MPALFFQRAGLLRPDGPFLQKRLCSAAAMLVFFAAAARTRLVAADAFLFDNRLSFLGAFFFRIDGMAFGHFLALQVAADFRFHDVFCLSSSIASIIASNIAKPSCCTRGADRFVHKRGDGFLDGADPLRRCGPSISCRRREEERPSQIRASVLRTSSSSLSSYRSLTLAKIVSMISSSSLPSMSFNRDDALREKVGIDVIDNSF